MCTTPLQARGDCAVGADGAVQVVGQVEEVCTVQYPVTRGVGMSIPEKLLGTRAPQWLHDTVDLRARQRGVTRSAYLRTLMTRQIAQEAAVEALSRYDLPELLRRLTMPLQFPADRQPTPVCADRQEETLYNIVRP